MNYYETSTYIIKNQKYTKVNHILCNILIGLFILNILYFSKFIKITISILPLILSIIFININKKSKNEYNIEAIKLINICIKKFNKINIDYNILKSNTYITIRYKTIKFDINNMLNIFMPFNSSSSKLSLDIFKIYINILLNDISHFDTEYKKFLKNRITTNNIINKYFSILEINPMQDKSIIKKQYIKLLKKYHPDINPTGLEKTKQINIAYEKILECI